MRIVKCVSINRQTYGLSQSNLKGHGQGRLYSHVHLLTRGLCRKPYIPVVAKY